MMAYNKLHIFVVWSLIIFTYLCACETITEIKGVNTLIPPSESSPVLLCSPLCSPSPPTLPSAPAPGDRRSTRCHCRLLAFLIAFLNVKLTFHF